MYLMLAIIIVLEIMCSIEVLGVYFRPQTVQTFLLDLVFPFNLNTNVVPLPSVFCVEGQSS